ncbi:hypothetical protein ACLVWU_08225 [Bdellovibrio sp. HCB290]|uniref:hypothetical protein n=1 Tax=Bdellovibrio sp. HCB290 TaxID=3394356 RepID=UPI0039B63341
MKFSLRSLLVLGLCVSLSACAFKKEDAEDKQRQELADVVTQQLEEKKEKIAFEGTLTDENVKIRFDENETPGSYNLVIEWPEAVGMMEVELNGRLIGSLKEHSFKAATPHSADIHIELRAYASHQDGGGFLSSKSFDKQAPKDFILDGIHSLSNSILIDVERTYFKAGSKVITNGNQFELKTKKLIVEPSSILGMNEYDRAHVVTFPFDRKSSDPNELSPGKISINADKAYGDLMISMIGVNGADAPAATTRPAWDEFKKLPPQAANGKNGADGTIRYLRCLSKMDDVPCIEEQLCDSQPQNGGKGENGKDGIPGYNGTTGGNTGDLVISITDDSEFNANVYRKPGKGSKGTPGIPAQAPGAGGAPGKNPNNLCSNAIAGEPGKIGTDGEKGQDGADGAYGQITTNIKLDKRDN